MKRTSAFVFTVLVIAYLLTMGLKSCKGKDSFIHQKSDTAIVACVYLKDYSGNVFGGLARRFIRDSMKQYIDSSSGEQVIKKDWKRDTAYFFIVYDTVIDPKTKLPKKDSTGKFFINPNFRLWIPNQYVYPTTIHI